MSPLESHHHKTTKQLVKEDELMIFLSKAQEWFEKNWKVVSYIAGGIVVVALALWMLSISRANANRDAGFELAEARSFLMKGDYTTAADKLNALIKRRKGTEVADEASLTVARVKLVEGKHAEAEKLFTQFWNDHKRDKLKGLAAMNGIAVALEAQGKLAEAKTKYREVFELNPKAITAPQALIDAARAALATKDDAKAREWSLQLIREYPQSSLKSQAEDILVRVGR